MHKLIVGLLSRQKANQKNAKTWLDTRVETWAVLDRITQLEAIPAPE